MSLKPGLQSEFLKVLSPLQLRSPESTKASVLEAKFLVCDTGRQWSLQEAGIPSLSFLCSLSLR